MLTQEFEHVSLTLETQIVRTWSILSDVIILFQIYTYMKNY